MFGTLSGLSAYLFVSRGRLGLEAEYLAILFVASALVWVTLGVLACLKHVWAVRVGLVLNYLTVIIMTINLFRGDPYGAFGCLTSLVFLPLSVLQAHRVIGLCSKMRAADIPLDPKPE